MLWIGLMNCTIHFWNLDLNFKKLIFPAYKLFTPINNLCIVIKLLVPFFVYFVKF